MGRMLEAMKRVARQAPQEESSPAEAVSQAPAEPEAAADATCTEEVPFIEVGGRGKPMDASPSVLIVPVPKVLPDASGSVQKQHLDNLSPRPSFLAAGAQRSFSFRAGEPIARARTLRVAPEIIAFHDETHPVSEQYRTLFGKIQENMLAGEPPVLLFTAVAAGAGTTTTLLNLAVTCCKHGKQRVVVVDANVARPAVARRLGVIHAVGLAEVLNGTAALEQALVVGPQADLHVLAATTPVEAGRLLGEDNVRWLAARLRERFDIVLVDGPAWESSHDAAALASVADAVYLVLDAADADTPAVRKVTRTLAQRGWRLGGLILGQ